ncbi:DUF551 domain-containing protein [Escherichia coli]|nr:DUF551 domain-containing protein [Escherichia coli]
MSKIDYQALRERYSPKPVPECSVCGEEMSIQRISGAHVVYACSGEGDDGYFKIGRTFADEHYEESRVTVVDDSDPDVIALLDELEAAKSKLNEQREYYEGVISDGSKRIAELEKSEEQLINERDHAESALADMYFAATGDRPEWSNWFGFSDAVDAVVDRIADLEAKQPSPVVPEEKPMPNPLKMYAVDAVAAIAEVRGWNACRAAMLQAETVSNSDELPLDYLQGHKDGLEWAAQLAEANHPQTGDWLYDDPIDLARAIRKGPDMPTVQAGNYPVTPDGWISCSERMPDKLIPVMVMYEDGEMWSAMWNGNRWDDGTEYPDPHSVTHWREMPAAPQQEVK